MNSTLDKSVPLSDVVPGRRRVGKSFVPLLLWSKKAMEHSLGPFSQADGSVALQQYDSLFWAHNLCVSSLQVPGEIGTWAFWSSCLGRGLHHALTYRDKL